MATEPLKVVSWNIMHGLRVEQATDVLRTDPRLADLDVLLLQEMDEAGTESMAAELGLYHVYATGGPHAKSGRDFGNAVLSKAPLRNRTVLELPYQARFGGHPRVAVSAVAELRRAEVTLCSTHTEIPAMSTSRRHQQFATVASAATGWTTDQAIVGGDFNTVTSRGVNALVRLLQESGLAHVSKEAITTLRRVGQNFTLDHIFARGLRPLDSGVVRGHDVSDHWPIWVLLEPWPDAGASVAETAGHPGEAHGGR